MLDSRDGALPEVNKAAAASPDVSVPEIKAQAADSILGPSPAKKADEGSKRAAPSGAGRLLRVGPRLLTAVCLLGLAWVGVSYSRGNSPFDFVKPNNVAEAQQSAQADEPLSTVRQMNEEIQALKSSVEAMSSPQDGTTNGAKDRDGLKARLDSAQTKTNAAIADLGTRLDKLERDSNAKLAQMSEQLDAIQHQLAAPRVASAAPTRKPVEHHHDAFNPSQDPSAPGAPRSLGSVVNAGPAY